MEGRILQFAHIIEYAEIVEAEGTDVVAAGSVVRSATRATTTPRRI